METKNLPAMKETQIQFLGGGTISWRMATHSNTPPRKSMDRGSWWAKVHGVAKSWS